MAKRYDPVLGRWIHGLPDDAPEFGPVSDEPITVAFDGSWEDVGYLTSDGLSFTVTDESHVFDSRYFTSPQGQARTGRRIFFSTTPGEPLRYHTAQPRADRCPICWADPGECTHTGWDGNRSTIVDDAEPIRIPPAERAGPAMIGDGVLRGEVTGIGWPKVLERLGAIDDGLLQLAGLHAPSVEEIGGKLCRPECQGCFDTSGCHEEWPCESATILLRRIGLTERDLDYQLGDAGNGAEGGVQGA